MGCHAASDPQRTAAEFCMVAKDISMITLNLLIKLIENWSVAYIHHPTKVKIFIENIETVFRQIYLVC